MEKRAVIKAVHAMMAYRLFGGRPWLADREACAALSNKLDELGLQERAPGDLSATRSTTLGIELQLDLVMVFIGLWDILEMPRVLENYGLINEHETDEIFDRLCTVSADDADNGDPEAAAILRPVVRRAFQVHYNPSGLRN